jgi:hypothetical protein
VITDPKALLIEVATFLDRVDIEYAFTGGAVIPFYLDIPDLASMRPTKDVDVIVQAVTLLEYHDVEQRIVQMGWRHDASPGAPRCRWIMGDVKIDVMASSEVAGEFSSPWFQKGVQEAVKVQVAGGSFRVVPVSVLIASKLLAFTQRGIKDPWLSHDLEDVMTIVDGRVDFMSELEATDSGLRDDIAFMMRQVINLPDFLNYLPGFLPSDPGSQGRCGFLESRLRKMAQQ